MSFIYICRYVLKSNISGTAAIFFISNDASLKTNEEPKNTGSVIRNQQSSTTQCVLVSWSKICLLLFWCTGSFSEGNAALFLHQFTKTKNTNLMSTLGVILLPPIKYNNRPLIWLTSLTMNPICGSLTFCSPSCCSGRLEWNGADCSLVVQELFSTFGIPLQGAFNREDLTPCPPREGLCTCVTKERALTV